MPGKTFRQKPRSKNNKKSKKNHSNNKKSRKQLKGGIGTPENSMAVENEKNVASVFDVNSFNRFSMANTQQPSMVSPFIPPSNIQQPIQTFPMASSFPSSISAFNLGAEQKKIGSIYRRHKPPSNNWMNTPSNYKLSGQPIPVSASISAAHVSNPVSASISAAVAPKLSAKDLELRDAFIADTELLLHWYDMSTQAINDYKKNEYRKTIDPRGVWMDPMDNYNKWLNDVWNPKMKCIDSLITQTIKNGSSGQKVHLFFPGLGNIEVKYVSYDPDKRVRVEFVTTGKMNHKDLLRILNDPETPWDNLKPVFEHGVEREGNNITKLQFKCVNFYHFTGLIHECFIGPSWWDSKDASKDYSKDYIFPSFYDYKILMRPQLSYSTKIAKFGDDETKEEKADILEEARKEAAKAAAKEEDRIRNWDLTLDEVEKLTPEQRDEWMEHDKQKWNENKKAIQDAINQKKKENTAMVEIDRKKEAEKTFIKARKEEERKKLLKQEEDRKRDEEEDKDRQRRNAADLAKSIRVGAERDALWKQNTRISGMIIPVINDMAERSYLKDALINKEAIEEYKKQLANKFRNKERDIRVGKDQHNKKDLDEIETEFEQYLDGERRRDRRYISMYNDISKGVRHGISDERFMEDQARGETALGKRRQMSSPSSPNVSPIKLTKEPDLSEKKSFSVQENKNFWKRISDAKKLDDLAAEVRKPYPKYDPDDPRQFDAKKYRSGM